MITDQGLEQQLMLKGGDVGRCRGLATGAERSSGRRPGGCQLCWWLLLHGPDDCSRIMNGVMMVVTVLGWHKLIVDPGPDLTLSRQERQPGAMRVSCADLSHRHHRK